MRLAWSRLLQGVREELTNDPDTGRLRVLEHLRRWPGLLVEHDLFVGAALALAIGLGIGEIGDLLNHLRRGLDDVYVGTSASLLATCLTVVLLRVRDRHELHS